MLQQHARFAFSFQISWLFSFGRLRSRATSIKYARKAALGTCEGSLAYLQGTGDVAPRALGIRNTNAPAGKPPAAATKGPAVKRGASGTGPKVKSSSNAAALNSGPADDDDAGLAAGTLSKAEAEEKMLGLFGEGTAHLEDSYSLIGFVSNLYGLICLMHAVSQSCT